MSVLSVFKNIFGTGVDGSAYSYRAQVNTRLAPVELPQAALYHVLRQFYLSNGVYQELSRQHTTIGRATPQLRAIRNPIAPVVNFWSAKTFPEPLEIVTERQQIIAPIQQVWTWSNWQRNRRLFARYLALFGESYLKVIANAERGRVYFEVITPEHVTDFEADERDYLTMTRLDVPVVERDRTGTRRYTHTEAWSKERGDFRIWRTDGDASQRMLDDLGEPTESGTLAELGIDFVPFSRAVFSDIGEPRGIGAVQLALEAIVDADLSATNLHALVYQDADGAWVLKSVGLDANNRPLPPPVVAGNSTSGAPGREDDGSVTVGKRSFWRLGGNQELQSVVPDIDYAAALAILQDHDEHLEKLMPALAYARVSELSGQDLSGRAIRFKLAPALDQAQEVRANALAALAQADEQALTMGAAAGIPLFRGLGTFEAGDFAHTFRPTEIVETSDFEQAQTHREQAQAFATFSSAGLPLSTTLTRVLEMTDEEAEEIVTLAADEADEALERQQRVVGEQEPDENEED